MNNIQDTLSRIMQNWQYDDGDDVDGTAEAQRKIKESKKAFFESIPKIYRTARMNNFADLSGINNWMKSPEGFLYITGPCGCGKTHLSYAMAIEFARAWVESADFSSPHVDCIPQIRYNATAIFREIYEAIKNDKDTGLVQKLKTTKLPVIFDDIGTEKPTEFVRATWFEIVDERYAWGLPTVFVSNLNTRQIAETLSDRIASRIASGKSIMMAGRDRRIEK